MFQYIILIFVLQIYYCSATCDCPCGFVIPTYGIYLIGIALSVLFLSTVALAVILYNKRVKNGDDRSLFENIRHLSISKYERQASGDSQRKILRDSINDDDTAQINLTENMCDGDNLDENDTEANKVKLENEIKSKETLTKVRKQAKVPVFPQMKQDQMNELIKAVLSKQRIKEFTTSLSDLDKIVNDAKDGAIESKTPDISLSTPVLDHYDEPPSPIPKLPVYEANSKESKLRDEMKAIFSQDLFKAKYNQDKTQLKEKENENENNVKMKDEEIKPVDGNTKKELHSGGINLKLITNELQTMFKHEDEVNVDQDETKSKNNRFSVKAATLTDGNAQYDIYDFPPHNDVYDFPPSPKPHQELYDVLPTNKSHEETYDVPPLCQPVNELYDIPPSPKPQNEIYDCPPTSRTRNVIVSDGDDAGYLFPITDPNSEDMFFNDPQYSNAKTIIRDQDQEKEIPTLN